MASGRLSVVLELDLASSKGGRKKTNQQGSTRPDLCMVAENPTWGSTSHPRGAAQVGFRNLRTNRFSQGNSRLRSCSGPPNCCSCPTRLRPDLKRQAASRCHYNITTNRRAETTHLEFWRTTRSSSARCSLAQGKILLNSVQVPAQTRHVVPPNPVSMSAFTLEEELLETAYKRHSESSYELTDAKQLRFGV